MDDSATVFTDNVSGPDTTKYVTTGSTLAFSGARAELVFPGLQNYLGILWGSIDGYNTLSFYNGTVDLSDPTVNRVGLLIGTNIRNPGDGSQVLGGTHYVNVISTLLLDRLVATSNGYAFEFDSVA